MTEASTVLKVAAATIAKHAPAEWADFRAAMGDFVIAELIRSTSAPTNEAQRQLGYTQCLIQMRDLLLDDLDKVMSRPPLTVRK